MNTFKNKRPLNTRTVVSETGQLLAIEVTVFKFPLGSLDSHLVGVDLHVGGGLCAGAIACAHDVESAEDGGGGKEDPV